MFIQVPLKTRRLAFAGKVVDAVTAQPIAGVVATLSTRPDRAISGADGCFAFLDLPDGDYEVSLALPRGSARYGSALHKFLVPRDPAADPIHLIHLPPTGAQGRVVARGSSTPLRLPRPLPLARVRVEGSGELAYCDEQGRFYLSGVEAGDRRLSAGAAGYRRVTVPAQINVGSVVDLGTITLDPATA
jgi:hypothetical protein